jgi:hypothetical protein
LYQTNHTAAPEVVAAQRHGSQRVLIVCIKPSADQQQLRLVGVECGDDHALKRCPKHTGLQTEAGGWVGGLTISATGWIRTLCNEAAPCEAVR